MGLLSRLFGEKITTDQAAERLGITRQGVIQKIKRGEIEAELFNGVYIVDEDSLKNVTISKGGRPKKKKDQ